MARTGRFGRLPTQAPDLSSQIVSLMEQWMAAEDRNLLDAWTNGGKYKGKKVTDRDILAHYRKRRNSYDRDDPEWDEWDQDLWQVRYQIADEKVQMQYRMGRIGPAAVAAHYRSWARKMPKDSSYYRNLMATAGDFAKAAAAGSSAGQKGFDYEAMQDRINALERRENPITAVFNGLTEYAVARGFIPKGTDIMDPNNLNSFESYDLAAMLDGYTEDPDHRVALVAAQEAAGFSGRLTVDRVQRLVDDYVDIQKKKIAVWRGAPYDMSSYIKGARDNIRDARSYARLVNKQLDIGADLAVAYDIFSGQTSDRVPDADPRRVTNGEKEEGIMGAIDPDDALSGDANFLRALRRGRDRYAEMGQTEMVAALSAIIKGISPAATDADIQALNELDPTVTTQLFGAGSPWAREGGMAAFASERKVLRNAQALLAEQQAVIYYVDQPSAQEQALGEAAMTPFRVYTAEVNANGKMTLKDPLSEQQLQVGGQFQIAHVVGSNGKLIPMLVEGTPILDVNNDLVGYQWDIRGSGSVWGKLDASSPSGFQFTPFPTFGQGPGTTLEQREDGNIYITLTGEEVEAQQPVENVASIVERAIEVIERTEGLSPEEKEAKVETARGPLAQALVDEDWDAIINDPAIRQAYQARYQEAIPTGTVATIEGADIAYVMNSLRNNQNADIDFTEQEALFFDAGGYPRNPTTVMDLSLDPGNTIPANTVKDRARIVEAGGGSGVGYWQALQNAGVKDVDSLGWGEGAFGGAIEQPDASAVPTDIYTEDPEVQEAYATGDIARGSKLIDDALTSGASVTNFGLAAYLIDPNKQRIAQQNRADFDAINLMASGLDPVAGEAYLRDLSAVQTYGQYGADISKVVAGGSEAAAVAGNLYGFAGAYEANMKKGEQGLVGIYGEDWVGATPAEVRKPSFFTAGSPIRDASTGVERLDIMVPAMPKPMVQEVKPQPLVKLSKSLVPQGNQMVEVQKPITYPQGLVPNVAPKPVVSPVTVQAPRAGAPPPSTSIAPPPPPTIESAIKSLPR